MAKKPLQHKKKTAMILSEDPDSWLRKLRTETNINKWLNSQRDYITGYVLPEAQRISIEDPSKLSDQIKRIGAIVDFIHDHVTRSVYFDAIGKQWPIFKKTYKLRKDDQPTKKPTKVISSDKWTYILINLENQPEAVTDKLSDDQKRSIQQYGFVEYEKAYYFGSIDRDGHTAKLAQKSNFAMRILFHIKRTKNKHKRVIALYNTRGQNEVLDIDTKQLTSLQGFKEFTEGAGNYVFSGDNHDLMKIKFKTMGDEKPCKQLDTLGWHPAGFFAFANGVIYKDEFIPVDEFGIVSVDKYNYFIPYHPRSEESANINEKLFSWKPGSNTWEEWSALYYKVFGAPGMVCMMFALSTLFSDHIFYIRKNFPILFLYGEGGSGKSKMIQFLQHWFGDPQPSLKVSEKANTEKSKIRKLAMFSNTITLLEEFINNIDPAAIKTFTGFYDRQGYERSDIDSKFGTETVPVHASVAFVGNEYPSNDPFFQRSIIIDVNKNEFTTEQRQSYDDLNKMNRRGLTQITKHLLNFRPHFIEHWESDYEEYLEYFTKVSHDIKVPSRMVENNACLIATYMTAERAGITFPFKSHQLVNFLCTTLKMQAEKRDTGSAIQRFWDIVIHLLQQRKIENGKQLDLNGDELMIRISEIHSYYIPEYYQQHREQGLNKNSLMQKLRESSAFIEAAKSHRFNDINTSCFVFDVRRIGVDLTSWIWYDKRDYASSQMMLTGTDAPRSYSEPNNKD